jgi:hypothetical protein
MKGERMTDDPLKIHPVRTEPRGDFPVHSDTPRPVLTAEAARLYAAQRLAQWKREHDGE